MFKRLTSASQVLICGVLIIQLSGCGTLMYPERRGQKAGRVDVGVAVLDGLGLLLFLVPGIIAFAVDFSNGTIYLPATARSSLSPKTIKQVKFDPKHSTSSDSERLIKEQTGHSVKLNESDMKVTRLKSTSEMMAQFALISSGMQDTRLSLLH